MIWKQKKKKLGRCKQNGCGIQDRGYRYLLSVVSIMNYKKMLLWQHFFYPSRFVIEGL